MKSLEHIAFIMDGNGRWAKSKKKPVSYGHKKGVEVIDIILKESLKYDDIKMLTFYAFSTENWKRSETEIKYLMHLIKEFYKKKRNDFIENDIQFKFVGSTNNVPENILKIFKDFEEETKNCQRLIVNIAFNYGGRQEIIDAINEIIKTKKDKIRMTDFEKYLYSDSELYKNVDLLVRTSGEERISNFLLWQIAYAEFLFIDKYWPDFNKEDFNNLINEYEKRNRRFGAR